MSQKNSIMLEVKDLNKKYGEFHAVKDLNFQIQKGEVLGFLGPNGAGKTTTMRIITCFIPLTSGSVTVDGLDIRLHDLDIRKKIGYLPESTPLYNDMLVAEYLAFAGELRGLKGSILTKRIDDMYQVCGLGNMARRQIGKLSKGYRQRVGLAQALLHNPDLLILDEPTSGLDPNQIIEIRQLIKNIGQEKTVIYCSHILSEVSATCSRILIINQGRIVGAGTPEELITQRGGTSRYSMRVKADKASLVTKLNQIEGVADVAASETKGWCDVHASVARSEDIGEEFFKCVAANGWVLSELKRDTVSLEDVFTQLTRG